MNLKKALAILGGSIALLAVVLVLFGAWTLSKLPSPYEIKKAMTPAALQTPDKEIAKNSISLDSSEASSVTGVEVVQQDKAVTPSPALEKTEAEEFKEVGWKVIQNDFANPQTPMVESCKELAAAGDSKFLRDSENANAKYFFKSLASEQKDPLVESAAPIFRYVFRAPGMSEAMETLKEAEEKQDMGLLDKAEFYANILRAGNFLRENKHDVDVILQRSYNMHVLARAVGLRPELARDSATLSFCDQIEKAINNGTENFDATEEAQEVSRFLNENGIDPRSVGFDPRYRSQVKMNLSSTQVSLNDSWIVHMFARDIEKANKAKGQ